jgi:hypothetical protein
MVDMFKAVDWTSRTDYLASFFTGSNSDGFFLWRHLKEHLYTVTSMTIEELVARLQAGVTTVDANMLRRV